MTYSEFSLQIEKTPNGVVLLEGRRLISGADAVRAKEIANQLASRFRNLRFRSGNAEGSDEAFSDGIATVDASRLQVIAPYASHRKSKRYEGALYDSPESLTCVQDNEVVYKTSLATPSNKGFWRNGE